MSVTLRKKTISNGKRKSLYLDFYPAIRHPDTGILTRREFLKMYLINKPSNDFDKESNTKLLLLAQNVCAQRLIDIQNNKFGFLAEARKDGNFIDYFKNIAAKKTGTNAAGWEMGWRYLESYGGSSLRFRDLDEEFCEEYRDYLLSGPGIGRNKTEISANTAVNYFAKFRSMLKIVYKKKLIDDNLYDIVDPITEIESGREFLTHEEFQAVVAVPIADCVERGASIFGALTGLRFCDYKALRWSRIMGMPGNYYIQFNQQKTSSPETFPISDTAFGYLGERGEQEALVFEDLKYSRMKPFLMMWLASAGVLKSKFTPHCLRHTFASLLLALGTNIYTISKLMGHKSIKSTIRYLHLLEGTKKEAANKITLDPVVIQPTEQRPIVWQIHRND